MSIVEFAAPTKNDMLQAARAAETLLRGDIEYSKLPDVVVEVLRYILAETAEGHALAVGPIEKEMSTNQAADFLNVSRPYVIKLLDEGKLRYRRVGAHRRIAVQSLKDYKRRQDEASYAAMTELQALAQEDEMDIG